VNKAAVTEASPQLEDFMFEIRVGRQAIFDRNLDIYAYELLYRPAGNTKTKHQGDSASANTMLNTFMEVGLDKIAGNKKVFINLTRRFFTELNPTHLPKDRVVLEILEDIPVDEALLKKIKELKADGFTVALDDYMFEEKWDPVLELVDLIKVDVLETPDDVLNKGMDKLKMYSATLLAEKIESIEEFNHYMDLGFELFQGYFLEKPQIVTGKRMQENQAIVLRLLAKLNNPDVDIDVLEKLINQDPGLSVKILRYINSAAVGVGRKIDSIRQGVIIMGLTQLRAWASLFAMAQIDNKPDAIVNTGLLRGNLCKALCQHVKTANPDTAYTVGLFSILDVLTDTDMNEVLNSLPLSDDIANAILNKEGIYGKILETAIAAERNLWSMKTLSEISETELNIAFIESSAKTFEQVGAIKL